MTIIETRPVFTLASHDITSNGEPYTDPDGIDRLVNFAIDWVRDEHCDTESPGSYGGGVSNGGKYPEIADLTGGEAVQISVDPTLHGFTGYRVSIFTPGHIYAKINVALEYKPITAPWGGGTRAPDEPKTHFGDKDFVDAMKRVRDAYVATTDSGDGEEVYMTQWRDWLIDEAIPVRHREFDPVPYETSQTSQIQFVLAELENNKRIILTVRYTKPDNEAGTYTLTEEAGGYELGHITVEDMLSNVDWGNDTPDMLYDLYKLCELITDSRNEAFYCDCSGGYGVFDERITTARRKQQLQQAHA